MKKLIKYGIRVVLGLFTLFLGLITYCALTPMDEYPCEAGQEEWSALQCVLAFVVSIIALGIAWYKTKDW